MPVPADAAGAVFIRRQDTEVHIDDKGQLLYNSYRIKLLHPSALQLGNVAISWNPAAGAPVVHSIKIHRGGEVIDVLAKSEFEILRREDQLEAARIDGVLTAVLRVPDLRVGDELEYAATIRTSDPTLGKDYAGLLALPPELAQGRFHRRLSWSEGRTPTVKISPDLKTIVQQGPAAYEFDLDNPQALTGPMDAPPRFQWVRLVEYSSFADWQSLSRRFAPLYDAASRLGAGSPLKGEAARIAAANPKRLDRLAAALRTVQQDVRYVYVGLDGGNLTPAAADETWQRRFGDCKGKSALLLALLRELGIDAEAVLVNASGGDDGLDERLPNPGIFDHVVVRARVEGKTYWLDGTLPAVVTPAETPAMPFEWVLPLTAAGGKLERLDWRPAARPESLSLFEIDARAGFDQPAHIVSTTIRRGLEGLKEEAQLSALTPAQLLSTFRQHAIGNTWQTIDEVKWRFDPKARASILTISGNGTVDWETGDKGTKSLALPGGGFSPPDKRVRPVDQNQDLPYYNKPEFTCHVTTVRLPGTTRARQWASADSYDQRLFGQTYHRAFALRDGAIRMVRGFRVERDEIDAATARQDNGRVAKFDNSMGYIYFDPATYADPLGSTANVPATYEIDWTADEVPCLSTGSPAGTGQTSAAK